MKPGVLLVATAQRRGEGLVGAAQLGAPVHVAVGIDIAAQRDTAAQLARGFQARTLQPIYAPAHGVHPLLASVDEWLDELRLAQELVHDVLGAPQPVRRGVVCASPTPALVEAMEQAGFDFVVPGAALARAGERLLVAPAEVYDFDRGGLAGLSALAARVTSGGAELVAADELLDPVAPPWIARAELRVDDVAPETAAAAAVLEWLLAAFGWERAPRITAAALVEEGVDRLPPRARLPLYARRVKAGERAPAYRAAAVICDALAVESRVPGAAAQPAAGLAPGALEALARTGRSVMSLEPALGAYDELARMRFAGASRWRVLCGALRDWFVAEAKVAIAPARVSMNG
jgi:hypothetical protein